MTIKKSQGQSLSYFELFLLKLIFTHGQLYVAVSIVQSKKGLKIFISDENKKLCNITKNVVYQERCFKRSNIQVIISLRLENFQFILQMFFQGILFYCIN